MVRVARAGKTGFFRSAGPFLLVLLLAGPVVAGFLGTLAPAFGFLPVLGSNSISLTPVAELLRQPGILMSMVLSLTTGLAATVISVSVVMLFVAACAGTPAFRRMQKLLSPLLSVPHASAAFGLGFLIAPSGWLLRGLSPWLTGFSGPPDVQILNDPYAITLIAGLVIKEIPFLFLMAIAALHQIPLSEARREMASLGFGRISGFLIGPGPALYRQIRLPVLAVLAFSVSVVDVALILGPQLPSTLAVRITQWMADPDLQKRFLGSAGAMFQMLVLILAAGVWFGFERLARVVVGQMANAGFRLKHDSGVRRTVLGLMLLSGCAVFAGLVTLLIWSVSGLWPFPLFLPKTLTLQVWMRTLPQLMDPVATTLIVAAASGLLSLFVTVLTLWNEQERQTGLVQRFSSGLVYLPLLVPQLSFVFGLQVLFLSFGLAPGLLVLILVHSVFVLPYVYLSLKGPWVSLDPRYEHLARSFGKSSVLTLFQIRLPLLLRPVLTALAVGFAVSIGLYLPTVLIGAGRLPTLTTEAVALASGGDRRIIGVYALLQTLLPFAGFWLATMIPPLLQPRYR